MFVICQDFCAGALYDGQPRSWNMQKSLQNLERLCQKMQARYGAHDQMVVQLLEELEARKQQSPNTAHWSGTNERRTAAHPRVHMRSAN
jgi:hypothetical protein